MVARDDRRTAPLASQGKGGTHGHRGVGAQLPPPRPWSHPVWGWHPVPKYAQVGVVVLGSRGVHGRWAPPGVGARQEGWNHGAGHLRHGGLQGHPPRAQGHCPRTTWHRRSAAGVPNPRGCHPGGARPGGVGWCRWGGATGTPPPGPSRGHGEPLNPTQGIMGSQ